MRTTFTPLHKTVVLLCVSLAAATARCHALSDHCGSPGADERRRSEKNMASANADLKRIANDEDAIEARCKALINLGRYSEALADANRAIKLNPDSAELLSVRAHAELHLNQYPQALRDIQSALQLDPESWESYFYRAMIEERTDKRDLAAKDYERARALGSDEKPDYSAYMEAVSGRIRQAWHPQRRDKTKTVVAIFKVSRSGQVSGAHLQSSSGDAAVDATALKAIDTAGPMPKLPLGAPHEVRIRFSFDYNVFSGGKEQVWQANEARVRKVITDLEKADGTTSPMLISPLLESGDNFAEQRKFTDAEAQYQRVKEIVQGSGEAADAAKSNQAELRLARVNIRLAEVALAQNKTDEADKLYTLVVASLSQPTFKPSSDLLDHFEAYAKLLYRASKFDEAKKAYSVLKECRERK